MGEEPFSARWRTGPQPADSVKAPENSNAFSAHWRNDRCLGEQNRKPRRCRLRECTCALDLDANRSDKDQEGENEEQSFASALVRLRFQFDETKIKTDFDDIDVCGLQRNAGPCKTRMGSRFSTAPSFVFRHHVTFTDRQSSPLWHVSPQLPLIRKYGRNCWSIAAASVVSHHQPAEVRRVSPGSCRDALQQLSEGDR